MTRNEKITLAIGGGVVVFGGLALYFSATAKPPSAPTSPIPPPTPTSTTMTPSSFAPTTSPAPHPASPSSSFPPSWNQFTSVIAGHRYLITLHSATPFDWSRINENDIPGSFTNLRSGNPSANYFSYTLDAHVSHQVQNVMFLLGLTAYIDVTVYDLGTTP